MNKPMVGTAILLSFKDRYLLAKRLTSHEYGKYGCPGGSLDFGESPEEGIIREVKEETNLNVKNVSFTGLLSSNVYAGDIYNFDRHFVCVWFRGEVDKPEDWDMQVDFIEKDYMGNNKSEGWKWFTKEEMVDLNLMTSTKEAVLFEGSPVVIKG